MNAIRDASPIPTGEEREDVMADVITADDRTNDHAFILLVTIVSATDDWQRGRCDNESAQIEPTS